MTDSKDDYTPVFVLLKNGSCLKLDKTVSYNIDEITLLVRTNEEKYLIERAEITYIKISIKGE